MSGFACREVSAVGRTRIADSATPYEYESEDQNKSDDDPRHHNGDTFPGDVEGELQTHGTVTVRVNADRLANMFAVIPPPADRTAPARDGGSLSTLYITTWTWHLSREREAKP